MIGVFIDVIPYVVSLVTGALLGLVGGAYLARVDLRAAEAELAELRPSRPSGFVAESAAPSTSEGR
jgi:hypothetical protein